MNKKMMVMPLLFLILMAVPMVASEGNETDVIIPPPPPPLPITNETDPVIIVTDDIQEQLYKIYDWMWTQDELMMNGRNAAREMNATLSDVIVDLDDSVTILMSSMHGLFNEALSQDLELQSQIDTQNVVIEELRQEVAHVYQELEMERTSRNNLTIMFGLFSVIIIVITYASARKEKAVEGVR